MQHIYAIVGSIIGIVGTAALSYDLLKSKSAEDSVADFRRLQDQLDLSSQELTVRLNGGLSTLAKFLSEHLKFQELEARIKEEDAAGKRPPKGVDPQMDKIRDFIDGHSELSLRGLAVQEFEEAQKSLASPEQIKQALALNADIKRRIEDRFAKEIAHSQRMRHVASIGVILVGIGAIAQLIDYFV